MNKAELLERIIDEMSKVRYYFSDESGSDAMTRFFHVYKEAPEEFKELVLRTNAKLLGDNDLGSMKYEYRIGEALYRIPDVRKVRLNTVGNIFAFYEIHLQREHDEGWVKRNLESATRRHFPDEDLKEIVEYDFHGWVEDRRLSPEFKCYSWADEENCLYNSITFAVKDNAFPDPEEEIPF